MRKVVVSEFVTLDGVMESPDKWSFKFWNDEAAKYKFDELFASDALLIGRVTYQIFADAWPTLTDAQNMKKVEEAGGDTRGIEVAGAGENQFADRMNGIPKFVASTTLKTLGWNNSSLLKGDVVQAVRELKEKPGGDILIYGSGQLTHSLMQNGLVDEIKLIVFPIVLGSGKRLFGGESEMKALKLVDTQTFKTGVVVLTYRPA